MIKSTSITFSFTQTVIDIVTYGAVMNDQEIFVATRRGGYEPSS